MKRKRPPQGTAVKKKRDDYHGFARYIRTPPHLTENNIESVNLELSFDEALKLSLAVQSGVLALNSYHRGSAKGRKMGLLLSIKTKSASISVLEHQVPES